MARPDLDTTMAAELPKTQVRPVLLASIALASGVERVWSGVGPLVWNGKTYSGLGEFVSMGGITENSDIQAAGTTVTLNFAPSQLPVPDYPTTPPDPPRATVAGESVAWSFAQGAEPYVLGGPGGPVIGTTSPINLFSASVAMSAGDPLGQNCYGAEWFSFAMPLEVPRGARITGMYPVMTVSTNTFLGSAGLLNRSGQHPFYVGPGSGTIYGASITDLAGSALYAQLFNTSPGGASLAMVASFVGFAIYYMGSPLTETSLVYEALNDVRLGAPAKIWFGFLKPDGTFAGNPYLIFKGSVDQPSVKLDPAGSSITLALESRMVNLQRASNRKYTAADQHLDAPNDMGFEWVEILQEISLKQGS